MPLKAAVAAADPCAVTTALPAPSPELLAAMRALPGVADVRPASDDAVTVDLEADATEADVSAALAELVRDQWGAVPTSTTRQERIAAVAGPGRLGTDEVVLRISGSRVEADVVVSLDDAAASGSSAVDGPPEAALPAAVVTAVLFALEELTEDAVIGTVEQALLGPVEASVRLRLDIDGAEVVANGESAVVAHPPQAIVRAVLAAVEPHLPA